MPRKAATVKPAEPEKVAVSAINLRGTESYRAWLSSMSKKTRITAAGIVRMALEEWAAKHGHPMPPEK